MNILSKARHLESKIARALDHAAQRVGGSDAPTPLETIHHILDAVESHVEPAGRGRRSFPFNRIRVTLLAPTRHDRARLEAVAKGSSSLQTRIVDRLRAAGCEVTDLVVAVTYAAARSDDWAHASFHLDFDHVTRAVRGGPAPDENGPGIELVVTRGATEKRTHSLKTARIDLGRRAEVRDSRQRLIRANHVAFLDDDDAANQSVSRCHAHIGYDPVTSSYRVHDDGSAHGTAVIRGGKSVEVPRGSRGVRLKSGDELVLGQARVRVRIQE